MFVCVDFSDSCVKISCLAKYRIMFMDVLLICVSLTI